MTGIAYLYREIRLFNNTHRPTWREKRFNMGKPYKLTEGLFWYATKFLLGLNGKPRNAKQIAQRIRVLIKDDWNVTAHYVRDEWVFYIEKHPLIALTVGRHPDDNEMERIMHAYKHWVGKEVKFDGKRRVVKFLSKER